MLDTLTGIVLLSISSLTLLWLSPACRGPFGFHLVVQSVPEFCHGSL